MTVSLRPTSTPVIHGLEGRSLQAADQPVWLKQAACIGYCQTTFPAFDLSFGWGAEPPSFGPPPEAPMGPDPSWRELFTDQRIVRRPIKQVYWDPPAFVNTQSLYTNCTVYWEGRLTNNDGNYLNTRWYLFYTNKRLFGTPPATQEQILQADSQPIPLEDTESSVVFDNDTIGDPNGTGLSEGPAHRGWILAIVKKQIYASSPSPSSPLVPWFHPYALYTLHPQNYMFRESFPSSIVVPVVPHQAIFNCNARNTWVQAYNPLLWPPHIIQTIPRGP